MTSGGIGARVWAAAATPNSGPTTSTMNVPSASRRKSRIPRIGSARALLDDLEEPHDRLDARLNCLLVEPVSAFERVAPYGHLEAAVRLHVAIASVDDALDARGEKRPA